MKTRRQLMTAAALAALAFATPVIAQTTADMTEGEVRKVDAKNKKITLKHGAIKNLDMPPMTMVFQVADPAMLGKLKAGDKVQFKAKQDGGTLTVTELRPAK